MHALLDKFAYHVDLYVYLCSYRLLAQRDLLLRVRDEHDAERPPGVVDLCNRQRGAVYGNIAFWYEVREQGWAFWRRFRKLEEEAQRVAVGRLTNDSRSSIYMGLTMSESVPRPHPLCEGSERRGTDTPGGMSRNSQKRTCTKCPPKRTWAPIARSKFNWSPTFRSPGEVLAHAA